MDKNGRKKNNFSFLAAVLLLCLFLFFTPGCNWFKRHKVLISISPSDNGKVKYHYLKPGETLWKISRKYKVNLDYLIKVNHIENPDKIPVGTRIIIPLDKNYKIEEKRVPSTKKSFHYSQHKKHRKTKKKKTSSSQFKDPTFGKYRGKFLLPIEGGKLVLKFHQDKLLYKEGISFELEKSSSVKAIYQGMVEYVGNEIEGYGNTIIISHPDDYYSLYAFLSQTKVEIGDSVKKGQILGTTGKKSTKDKNYYFHFQLRKGVNSIDPLPYFSTYFK